MCRGRAVRAPTAYLKVRLIFCRARCHHRAVPGRPVCRPYEMRESSGLAVRADDLGGPQAHTVRPCGVPGDPLVSFPSLRKKLAPQAKPCEAARPKRKSETYPPHPPPFGGTFPPRGRLFWGGGETPPHPPRRAELCKIGRRRNSHPQGKPFAFFLQLCYNNSKMPDYALIWRYPCPTFKY